MNVYKYFLDNKLNPITGWANEKPKKPSNKKKGVVTKEENNE